MEILGRKELFDHMIKDFPKRLNPVEFEKSGQYGTITRKVFKGYTFSGKFLGVKFKDCKFIDCEFDNFYGFFCIFNECKFTKTRFINSRFSHIEWEWKNLVFENCFFKSVQLDEGMLYNTTFEKCTFDMFYMYDFRWVASVLFNACDFQNFRWQSISYSLEKEAGKLEEPEFYFMDCTLDVGNFSSVDFSNSIFHNTLIFETSFVDCYLGEDTIFVDKTLKFESRASIDFQTIIQSEDINPKILSSYFNIKDSEIKKTIKKITSKVDYNYVFISFSFKDIKFAKRLHKALTDRGIRTFFWVKDAPTGELLEDIMSRAVKATDKILFIASTDSIKSPACQFELTEGRKKQTETWETVLFPIHLDHFLFEVTKNKIPFEKADEYWRNIEELRRINSADFSEFNKDSISRKKFREAVNSIVAQLKL
ncbi:toll/interleukin-1 receptor domain-containing protein [Pedobacter mucosus]|uniref:toll/interleukin-1 receptor domain-containing protein n=1 Tax=Pedobacter mucosus TaxID=2895286 RepID=UPI001EE3B371|nr:TIR domain-containing protein [Pedobacter mucosus]UKT64303.1 TIR domain-containing protein [Pedobacter mucosus]